MSSSQRHVAAAAVALATTLGAVFGPIPSAQAATAKCVGISASTTRCYYLDGYVSQTRWIVFSDSMENDTNRTATLSCSASVSKTDSVKVSVSVTAGVETFLLAKAELTVGGEVQEQVTTGYVTTGQISVPAHTITYCDRGTVRDKFKGHYTDTTCSSSACSAPKRTDFTMTAPVRARWWFTDVHLGS